MWAKNKKNKKNIAKKDFGPKHSLSQKKLVNILFQKELVEKNRLKILWSK